MDSAGMKPGVAALERVLGKIGPVAVAVSGGVDSMTLAVVAHRVLGGSATMLHAVSAAVPADATERVERYARREGWRLERIDAGERCALRRQSGQPLLLLQDEPLRDDRAARRRRCDHRLRHQHRRSGGLSAGARGRGRARGAPPLRRVRHRQVHGPGHRGPARARRPRRASGRAMPVEPGGNRHRHRPRGVEGHRCVRTDCAERDGGRPRCDAGCAATPWWSSSTTLRSPLSMRPPAPYSPESWTSAWPRPGVSRTVRFEPYRMGSAFLRPSGHA